jgi:histidyl-tRNA synthetase
MSQESPSSNTQAAPTTKNTGGKGQAHQAPPGTRDVYPLEAARRRFIQESWRRASLLHGFEEVDGPTFEHLDLYTVKSGEGIVNELFSFQRAGGERTYALRPEFTPTLARLYAAKANALPKPAKWFTTGPFFRAERPQRGRLREFLQWNVDMLGDVGGGPSEVADAEVIATCVSLLRSLGLTSKHVRVKVNHRKALAQWLVQRGLPEDRHAAFFKLLDGKGKMPEADFSRELGAFGFSAEQAAIFRQGVVRVTVDERDAVGNLTDHVVDITYFAEAIAPLAKELAAAQVLDWVDFDLSVVRGLAYYTGMVFEVFEASGAERAIAGGGRYDNLIELFGGPATPAVGFGMGDVVLGLVLQDKGLMPSDEELLRRAGHTPDVFVLPNGTPEAESVCKQLVAKLRELGIAARHTYKTTRNVGKLLQEAGASKAVAAIIVEGESVLTLKVLRGQGAGQQAQFAAAELSPLLGALAQLGVRPR